MGHKTQNDRLIDLQARHPSILEGFVLHGTPSFPMLLMIRDDDYPEGQHIGISLHEDAGPDEDLFAVVAYEQFGDEGTPVATTGAMVPGAVECLVQLLDQGLFVDAG